MKHIIGLLSIFLLCHVSADGTPFRGVTVINNSSEPIQALLRSVGCAKIVDKKTLVCNKIYVAANEKKTLQGPGGISAKKMEVVITSGGKQYASGMRFGNTDTIIWPNSFALIDDDVRFMVTKQLFTDIFKFEHVGGESFKEVTFRKRCDVSFPEVDINPLAWILAAQKAGFNYYGDAPFFYVSAQLPHAAEKHPVKLPLNEYGLFYDIWCKDVVIYNGFDQLVEILELLAKHSQEELLPKSYFTYDKIPTTLVYLSLTNANNDVFKTAAQHIEDAVEKQGREIEFIFQAVLLMNDLIPLVNLPRRVTHESWAQAINVRKGLDKEDKRAMLIGQKKQIPMFNVYFSSPSSKS